MKKVWNLVENEYEILKNYRWIKNVSRLFRKFFRKSYKVFTRRESFEKVWFLLKTFYGKLKFFSIKYSFTL